MAENITVYEKICRTRKPGRATAVDYILNSFKGFCELHGDRAFGDDHAVVGGIAKLKDMPVTVIGIEKGHDMQERLYRNFGCVLPEGYRKSLRLIKQAEKFRRPVVLFVDTQGANCGKGAEERGEGEAIARNLLELSAVTVPVITVMIDEVWMLENAYYSVISPESCASILFKDPSKAPEAAEHLKLTAHDLYRFGIVEKIVSEPDDFSNPPKRENFFNALSDDLYARLTELGKKPTEKLLADRTEKYRKIGRYPEYSLPSDKTGGKPKKKRWFSHGGRA